MKIGIGLRLTLAPDEGLRLQRLQAVFAEACNQIAAVARHERCWNRVSLHHLTYHRVREDLPTLGSQMACNAIYAVCRACRLVYQGAKSPFNIRIRRNAALPLIGFGAFAPVYFDRHTLAIKGDQVSLFTLEGRLHCPVDMTPQQRRHITEGRVQAIALCLRGGQYFLDFEIETEQLTLQDLNRSKKPDSLPEHVQIHPEETAPLPIVNGPMDHARPNS